MFQWVNDNANEPVHVQIMAVGGDMGVADLSQLPMRALVLGRRQFNSNGERGEPGKAPVQRRWFSQGLAPSNEEVEELKLVAGEYCDMSTFANFCKEVAHCNDSPELLAQLFACYDQTGTGKVPLQLARNILQNCGEVLTSEEMNTVLMEVGAYGDELDYKAFCRRILAER